MPRDQSASRENGNQSNSYTSTDNKNRHRPNIKSATVNPTFDNMTNPRDTNDNQGYSEIKSDQDEPEDVRSAAGEEDDIENEENIHERLHKQRQEATKIHNKHDHHHRHHHDENHRHLKGGHLKEFIKPDPTVKAQQARKGQETQSSAVNDTNSKQQTTKIPQINEVRVETVVDEEQLHKRFMDSISEKNPRIDRFSKLPVGVRNQDKDKFGRYRTVKRSSASTSSSSDRSHDIHDDSDRSPPPDAIIIPPNVAKSLSVRSLPASETRRSLQEKPRLEGSISREQLEYGPLLKAGEVQVLYRSPEANVNAIDRHLKEEQAKQVAPNLRQSPIAIMSMNPTYELHRKPLQIEYPATVENLRLNNTGFSWEVKLPYQISMTTSLYGAHLNTIHRYRLDQFHCHWGPTDNQGSEHTVDNRNYSAELHFVHYNMERYHTLSKAARHPDGLVVLSVFVDAHEDHHNHAELEKIVSHLKFVPLKGEHSIIKQAVRIENLLPANRSYWSYQGSLTTPPYFESVTWFVLKQPIKCKASQLQKFRNLKSSLHHDGGVFIRSNHRKTQPLNGRTIVTYDESHITMTR